MQEDRTVRRGRLLYIAEAALEYFISILVAGSYLATLTQALGFSDSLTGIVSAFISLGCLFQLLSVLFRPRRVKGLVVWLSIANQVLFLLLYVIPVSDFMSPTLKTVLFVIFIFTAYFLYNLAHPKKISWLMSLVPDGSRGRFTANKEIVSLAVGMGFSFGMGSLIDHFKAQNDLRTALIIGAAVIGVLMLLHTLSLLFTVEPDIHVANKPSLSASVRDLLKNKAVLRIVVVFVLYYIANYVAHPFYGTYQIKELGFSLSLVSLFSILASVTRILVSRLWGRYADKTSFAVMVEKCFLILLVSHACAAVATPQNGKILFTLYYLTHGIAMGGINSALTNMIFDYVPHEKRADSLAICQASAGTVGFLTTLCAGPLVAAIQVNGFTVFGISLYAQQVVSVISVLFLAFLLLYIRFVLIPKTPKSTA